MDDMEKWNKVVFDHKRDTDVHCVKMIKRVVGNASFLYKGTANSSISFAIFLRSLHVMTSYCPVLTFKQVTWVDPPPGWHKCNIDKAAKGYPGVTTCSGVFENYRGFHKGSFAKLIGVQFALFAESWPSFFLWR